MKQSLGVFDGPDTDRAEQRVDVWFRAGLVDAFKTREGTRVRFGGRRVAVYRDAGRGDWFAVEDRCPLCGEAVMAEGRLSITGSGVSITCPSDGATFPVGEKAGEASIPLIPVVVADGHVFLGFRHGSPGPHT